MASTRLPLDRILLGDDHPWAGYTAEVIEDQGGGLLVARLDNGTEVYAWPRQWKRVG